MSACPARRALLVVAALLTALLSLGAGPVNSFAARGERQDEREERAEGRRTGDEHRHKHEVGQGDVPERPGRARKAGRAVNKVDEPTPLSSAHEIDPIHMKVLVLAGDGTEPELAAITKELDYLGTPYEVMKMAPVPANGATDRLASKLSDLPLETAINAWYQGVVLTDAALTYTPDGGNTYLSALTTTEWASLRAFETKWNIRQVSWNGYPSADEGWAAPSGSGCTGNVSGTNSWCSTPPLDVTYGPAAAEVFGSYANLGATLEIENSWVTKAKALSDGDSAPLLVDAAGNALAVKRTHRAADGGVARESIALSYASSQHELANTVLSYGLVNWVTRGMFLGQRHVYLNAQIDDLMLADAVWEIGTPCGTNHDVLPAYRNTGNDITKLVAWQNAKRANPVTADLQVAMAYNGVGSTASWFQNDYLANDTIYAETTDTLMPAIQQHQAAFEWISHTWTHANLDWLQYPPPPAGTPFSFTGADTLAQLQPNDQLAQALGLTTYDKGAMVQPDVSGLQNAQFLNAAANFGIRYVVSDVSRGGTNANPSPNVGRTNALQPAIYQIPRRANNLYYNVTTPAEWLAEDNCLYPVGANGHVDTYQQLLDREADALVRHMLQGDVDPWMFHAANLRVYDGTHSLFTDLMDRVLQKYTRFFTLPVQTLTEPQVAQAMVARNQLNLSGARGEFVPVPTGANPGAITIRTNGPATIPVTGLLGSVPTETYGNQTITWVSLPAGGSQVFNNGTTPPPPTAPVAPTLTPTPVTFGAQPVNTSSAAQAVTIRNQGAVPVRLVSVAATGDFTATSNCPAPTASLAAGAACTASIVFRPTAAGARTGALDVAWGPAGGTTTSGTATDALSGTGTSTTSTTAPPTTTSTTAPPTTTTTTPPATTRTISVTPSNTDFGNQAVGTTSGAKFVVISNTGTAAVAISAITIAGFNAADFARSGSCPSSLAVGASCSVSVTFKPTGSGQRNAQVAVTSNAAGSTHQVTLVGVGTSTSVSITPTSIDFGNVRRDTTSAARTITVRNTGTQAITISSVRKTGSNPGRFQVTNGCGASLPAGATCSITVRFQPAATGIRTANVEIDTSAPGSPHVVTLRGNGTR